VDKKEMMSVNLTRKLAL